MKLDGRSSENTFGGEPVGSLCSPEKRQKATKVIRTARTLTDGRKRDCRSVRLYPKKHQVQVQVVP